MRFSKEAMSCAWIDSVDTSRKTTSREREASFFIKVTAQG
jgi:hypothetical protein